MTWLNGLSREEIREMLEDSCHAYTLGTIGEVELRNTLGKLGFNATDIEDLVRFHRPPAPENEDDGNVG